MADDKKKDDKGEEEPKKKGPLLWIILAVVLGLGGVGAGIFLAPKFMAPPPSAEAQPAAQPEATPPEAVEEPPVTVQWPPLVVDVRDEHGGSRHIKMVVTLEAKNERLEEELRAFGARGRQAVLGHVRAQKFEDLIDPDKFDAHQESITKLVQEKIGKSAKGEERVQAVLITDLVAQ